MPGADDYHFVAEHEGEYFVGKVQYNSSREPDSVLRLFQEGDEELLDSEPEISDYIGRINGHFIYDWQPNGQSRGSFDGWENISSELDPEKLDEMKREKEEEDQERNDWKRTF